MSASRRFLVTGIRPEITSLMKETGSYAFWLLSWEHYGGTLTYEVQAYGEHGAEFLVTARAAGITVDEIESERRTSTVRREEFCDGRLVKETDRINVSTRSQRVLIFDGDAHWLFDGQGIHPEAADVLTLAWFGGPELMERASALVKQASGTPDDMQTLRRAFLELGTGPTEGEVRR